MGPPFESDGGRGTQLKWQLLGRRYVAWWTDDLPPLNGILRFVFYAGLLLLAFRDDKSPFSGLDYYVNTDPALVQSYGLLKLLGIPYIAPEHLRVVIGFTGIAWVCAAVGFLGRWSAGATALGAAFLHGVFFGTNAFNHNWFLPIYTLILLAFARAEDRWSVDYHIRRWRGLSPRPSVASTGLVRKAVLVVTVGFYFAAGMTKLWEAGPQWADGHTIAYFAAERAAYAVLGGMLTGQILLSSILAILTQGLELGAIVALCFKRARWLLIPGWAAMHIGIMLTVGPEYFENIWCFILLIDWGAGWRKLAGWASGSLAKSPNSAPAGELASLVPLRSRVLGVTIASGLLPLVFAVALLGVFWWPLTNVYMYCSYFSFPRDIRAGHPRAAYFRAEEAQAIARSYLEQQPAIEATEYFAFLVQLRLVGPNIGPRYFSKPPPPGSASRKQWILTVVRPVLIQDLAAKPAGNIAFDPRRPDYPAQRFLSEYISVFRAHFNDDRWDSYERLELTYPLMGGEVPIASVPLKEAVRSLEGDEGH